MLRTFQVARRATQESYWLQASSHNDARHIVALNVPGAENAEKAEAFVCMPDPTKRPTLGFVVDQHGRAIPIERL